MVKEFRKGVHHSRKFTYLCYVLWKDKLDLLSLIIHLQILGNSQNIRKKVKYLMIIVAFLNNSAKLFKSHSHYTTVLFSSTEDYIIL